MAEGANELVAPLKSYIEGLGLIGGVVLTCAGLGGIIAIWYHGLNTDVIWSNSKRGAFLGFIVSILGGLEIAISLLFGPDPWQNKLSRSAGYDCLAGLLVWCFKLYLSGDAFTAQRAGILRR